MILIYIIIKSAAVSDDWCNSNCNNPTPYCPSTFCSCCTKLANTYVAAPGFLLESFNFFNKL